jgi:hypothetical protein
MLVSIANSTQRIRLDTITRRSEIDYDPTMVPSRLRCTVKIAGGPSRRVGAKGLLIGRHHECDVVTTDSSVSRRHALIQVTGASAEVVPLGRAPLGVNGKQVDRPRPLADGDVIRIGDLTLEIELRAETPQGGGRAMFRLERARGGSFGITHSPFVIGGGETDDLIVKRWPAEALRLHIAQNELFVEVTTGTARLDDIELAAGAMEPLRPGNTLTYRKESLVVRADDAVHVATTMVSTLQELPTRVHVEMLPRGGRVVFTVGHEDHAVYLADRQLDLIIALLRPPEELRGSFIPDDVLRRVVWPRDPGVSRPEINMLISRCRRSLVEARLSGPRLLVRAPGGGGTMLALAPNAQVDIES